MLLGILAAASLGGGGFLNPDAFTDTDMFFSSEITNSGWIEQFSKAATASSNGWNGFNVRVVIPANRLQDIIKSNIQLTLMGGSGENGDIDSCYVGHQASGGNPWDFDGSQVQMFDSASGSFTVPASGSLLLDSAAFSYDGTKALVLAAHYNNAAADNQGAVTTGVTGINWYFKSAASEVSTSAPTGYTTVSDQLVLLGKVEVQ